jgi:hypothetical protein
MFNCMNEGLGQYFYDLFENNLVFEMHIWKWKESKLITVFVGHNKGLYFALACNEIHIVERLRSIIPYLSNYNVAKECKFMENMWTLQGNSAPTGHHTVWTKSNLVTY